jgi:hypothetical protein
VELAIRIVVGLPAGEAGILFFEVKQGSLPGLLTGAVVEVICNVGTVVGMLGSDVGVSVGGNGVVVGFSVGGTGVEVGIAAWVSATIVKAIAAAVNCRSAGSIVGAASAPHALRIMVIAAIKDGIAKRFISSIISMINLTVGEASSLSNDAFISHHNCPTALYDSESPKHSKILRAVYECSSTVLSNRPTKATTGLELLAEIPALSQLSHNIQRESNYSLGLGFVCQIKLCGWAFPGC